jgi:hypothetical protein
MVDTVVLNLDKFAINKRHLLDIQPPVIKPTGEIIGDFNINGISASKAWHNGKKFNVTLKQKFGSPGQISAFVQTSLPRYQAENNTQAVDQRQAREIFQHLEEDLSAIGIESKINDANLSRLDLFRNAETKFPFETYSPVLNLMSGKRMKSQEFGGQGFMYRNSKHEIVAYDKLQEMDYKLKSKFGKGTETYKTESEIIKKKYLDKNLLRFEYRMKSHEKVSDVSKFETAKDLINYYPTLETIYKSTMKENLFKYDGRKIEILQTKKLESIFSELKSLYPRSYVTKFLMMVGMQGLSQYGTIVQISAALEKVSENKGTVSKFKSRVDEQKIFLEDLMQKLKRKQIDVSGQPINELYLELKRLVLAV